MEKVENNFIEKINRVYDQCSGYETYGSTTEFYDEDGVVLMTATEDEGNKIIFTFTEDSESYAYEEVESDEISDEM